MCRPMSTSSAPGIVLSALIAAFSNAATGGEWILQPAFENEDANARLLPVNAPLSTIRIVTSSRAALKGKPNAEAMPTDITALSACWRAGRAGAATDHSSVLFDVDLDSGALGEGTTNGHWYRLGLCPALRCPWDSGKHKVSEHPDSGVRIAGETRVVPPAGAWTCLAERGRNRGSSTHTTSKSTRRHRHAKKEREEVTQR